MSSKGIIGTIFLVFVLLVGIITGLICVEKNPGRIRGRRLFDVRRRPGRDALTGVAHGFPD